MLTKTPKEPKTGQQNQGRKAVAPVVHEAGTVVSVPAVDGLDAGAGLVGARELQADRDPVVVYLASLGSERSRATARSALRTIAKMLGYTIETCPWAAIRYAHFVAIRAKLAAAYAHTTANVRLTILRGVLRQARRLRQMSLEDFVEVCEVPPVKGWRELAGRAISESEMERLFKACDGSTNAGARDAAILGLGYGALLRRSEIAALPREACNLVTGEIRVIGKGNKERTAYAPPGSIRALRAWIAKRGDGPGPLFLAINKADRFDPNGAAVSDKVIANMLVRMAKIAAVTDLSPHDLRRTGISDLLDRGVDLATVAGLAGHSDAATTAQYDRRGERAKVRAAELLRVPFDG